MIEVLKQMEAVSPLSELCKLGIVSWTLVRDRELYFQWDIEVRVRGKDKWDAIYHIAEDWKMNWYTIYRAIKKMNPHAIGEPKKSCDSSERIEEEFRASEENIS